MILDAEGCSSPHNCAACRVSFEVECQYLSVTLETERCCWQGTVSELNCFSVWAVDSWLL